VAENHSVKTDCSRTQAGQKIMEVTFCSES